jgi:DNA polymerase-3 subunit beta
MTAVGVSVDRGALFDALARVALVAPRGGQSLPVLQSVRIAPDGDALRFTATDLDRTVSVCVPVDGAEDFPARVISCHRLAAIVGQLSPGSVRIEPRGEGVRIASGRARFDVTGLPADEFPSVGMEGGGIAVTVDAPTFVRAIARCATCAAANGGMTPLEGVHVKADKDGRITIEGCDRHQLLSEWVERSGGPALDFIVHASSVPVIAKLFANTERLTVELCGMKALIGSDDASVRFETSLMEGPYPDTNQIIKRELPHTATVNRVALLAAVKRVASVSANDILLVRMDWNADHVVVSGVGDDDAGTSEDVVPCESSSEKPIRITFGPRLLIHGLSLRTSETIRVDLKDADTMMTLRDDGSTEVQNLITPRREKKS